MYIISPVNSQSFFLEGGGGEGRDSIVCSITDVESTTIDSIQLYCCKNDKTLLTNAFQFAETNLHVIDLWHFGKNKWSSLVENFVCVCAPLQ